MTRKRKDEIAVVRLTKEEKERAMKAADKAERTLSDWLRLLIKGATNEA